MTYKTNTQRPSALASGRHSAQTTRLAFTLQQASKLPCKGHHIESRQQIAC